MEEVTRRRTSIVYDGLVHQRNVERGVEAVSDEQYRDLNPIHQFTSLPIVLGDDLLTKTFNMGLSLRETFPTSFIKQ